MLPLKANNEGEYYLGKTEVVVYPIGGKLGLEIGVEKGRFPPLEEVLSRVVSDAQDNGLDLTKANCYVMSLRGEIRKPELSVPDGRVPEQRIRYLDIQFYKAVPATEENKKQLKDIFSTSI